MLKVNYSDFERKNLQQIIKEADKRGIVSRNIHPSKVTRNDLIGMIIAHDAYYEGKNDAMREQPKSRIIKAEEPREKYCLRDEMEDKNYYLELTHSQVDFYNWLDNMDIDVLDSILVPINNTSFEAP